MKRIIFKLICVFLITVIISWSVGYSITQWASSPDFTYTVNGVVQTDFDPETLGLQIGLIIFFVFTVIFLWFYIVNISIIITTCLDTRRIDNKNIIYQRDLADDYNSAIASYILDGTVEVKQDYKAVLVELQEIGLIYKDNTGYKIKEEGYSTNNKLLSNQQIVLNQILEGKINFKKFKRAVIEDTKNLGYIKLNKKLVYTLVALSFIFPVLVFLLIFMLAMGKTYLNVLTEKGKKEKDKILKLKRYLTSFSNMNDLESSDNNIWGDYLAYAISLNVNKKLKIKRLTLK